MDRMDRSIPIPNKHKVPSELSLATYLSTGLTLVISVTYSVLCILALVYRNQCNAGLANGGTGDNYFIRTLYRIYIQKESCDNPESSPPTGVLLMSADTVFIFVIVVLVASVFCAAAAIALIIVVSLENKSEYIFAVTWTYVCICLSSLVVDITFSVFFGMDYAEMAFTMGNILPGVNINYRNDVLRLGALLFMTISLKGYLAPVINTILFILLAVYATKFRYKLQTDEHSIHKMGAINAYEQRVNRGYVPDEEPRRSPRSPVRAVPLTPLSDYSNSRDYDRSNSWQHQAQRPYSYMEEPRRPPRAPSSEPQWRRDPWPPAPPMPPVPAPDYSPPTARRLKSALKPNYM